MSRLNTISDKLDYIAMGKLNAEQMEYICEINQEVNLKDKEIERLNNIINEAREYIEERYNGEVLTHTFDKCNVGELLEILDKGSDKE